MEEPEFKVIIRGYTVSSRSHMVSKTQTNKNKREPVTETAIGIKEVRKRLSLMPACRKDVRRNPTEERFNRQWA